MTVQPFFSSDAQTLNPEANSPPISPKSSDSEITPQFSSLPPKVSFFEPEVYESLVNQGILKDENLTSYCELPPCSQVQVDTLVDLIEASFDLMDHNGTVVLKDLNARELLNFIFNDPVFIPSKILNHLQLAGSSVIKVIESDPEWVEQALYPILQKKMEISYFPKREPKDLDLHMICKADSLKTRSELIKRFLEELGRRLVSQNLPYLIGEISKLLSMPDNPKDKFLVGIKNEIAVYQNAVTEKASQEQIDMHLQLIAKSIIQRNCLKKFSDNSFGTIISFGSFELVLSEKTDYLLSPDKLVIPFDPTIKKGTRGMRLIPSDHRGVESLLHRKVKIASIDQEPTEFTFPRACRYIALGNHVLIDEKFIKACAKHVKVIYVNGLTKNGQNVVSRFCRNDLNERPEEALCVLFTMFRFFKANKADFLIPAIIKELKGNFKASIQNALLDAVCDLLFNYPNEFDLLSTCLQVIPIGQLKRNEKWISFKQRDATLPFVLRLEHDPQAFEKLSSSSNEKLTRHFLNRLFSSNLSGEGLNVENISYDQMQIWLDHPIFRFPAYCLCLTEPEKFLNQLLVLFPEMYHSCPVSIRFPLISILKQRIQDPFITKALDKFTENLDAKAWALSLIESSDYTVIAYNLWMTFQGWKDHTFSTKMFIASLRHDVVCAFKIMQASFLSQSSEVSLDIVNKAFLKLSQLIHSNSSLFERELSNLFPDIVTWLMDYYLASNMPKEARDVIDNFDKKTSLNLILNKSKQNFWPILKDSETLEFCDEVAKKGQVEKLSEGLQYLKTKKLSINNVMEVLKTFSKIKEKLNTAKPLITLCLLQGYLYQFHESLKWDLETHKERTSILFDFTMECAKLFKGSNSYIYFQSYQSSLSLLFSHSLEQILGSSIDLQKIVELTTAILNDRNNPVRNCFADFSKFISSLVKHLKAEKKESSISEIIKSIDTSSYHFHECPEIGEYRYLSQLQSTDARKISESDIHLFLENLQNKEEVKVAKDLLNFCDRLLEDKQYGKLSSLLTGVIAFSFQNHFNHISTKILEKLRSIKKIESFFDLLSIVIERKLYQNRSEEYSSCIISIIRQLNKNDVQKHWLFLYKLMDYFPILKKELLATLFEHVTSKNFHHLQHFWTLEIESENYGSLEPKIAAKCCIKFLSMLGKEKSHQIISLIQYLDNFKKIFEGNLTLKEINECVVHWIKDCHTVLNDPTNASDEDNALIGNLMLYITSLNGENSEVRKLVQRMNLRYVLYSRNPHYTFNALKVILKIEEELSDEIDFEIFKEVLLVNFEKLNSNSEKVLETPVAVDLIDLSRRCRTSTNLSSPLLRYLYKNILFYTWMTSLCHISSKEAVLEAFEWLKLYLHTIPPVKSKKNTKDKIVRRTIPLPKESKIFVKYILRTLLEDSNCTPTILKEILDILCLFERKSNDLLSTWETFTSAIFNNFYDDPLSRDYLNSTFIHSAWKEIIKRKLKVRFEIQPEKLIKSFIQLIYADQIELIIKLWNECFLTTVSIDNRSPGKNFYKTASVFPTQLKFASNPQDLQKELKVIYVTFLADFIAGISETKKDKGPCKNSFIYDFAANCLQELLSICKYDPKLFPRLISTLAAFLETVAPAENELFKAHITTICRGFFDSLDKLDPEYKESTEYVDHYIKLLCPGVTTDAVITDSEFELALEEIVSKLNEEDTNSFDLIYHAAMVYQVIKEGAFTKLPNLIHSLELFFDFIKKADFVSPSLFGIIPLESIFILGKNKTLILSKISAETDPKAAKTMLFTFLANRFLDFIGDNKKSEVQRRNWFVSEIDWFQGFKSIYPDYDEDYEGRVEDYLKAFDILTKGLKIPDIKRMHDKLMLWLTDFPFALSAQGKLKRVMQVNKWLFNKDLQSIEMQYICKITLLSCKKAGVYEGFNNLYSEMDLRINKQKT